MAFIKAKWRLLTFVAVCLGSLGMGGWAYLGGATVEELVKQLDERRRQVEGVRNIRANMKIIEERKKQVQQQNADFEKAMNAALAMQKNNAFHATVGPDGSVTPVPRTLLIEKVLPKPTKAQAINFKEAYVKAFDELKARLRGREKPSTQEITDERARKGAEKPSTTLDLGPWVSIEEPESARPTKVKERPLPEILRENPRTTAADRVARGVRMYVADNALGRQNKLLTMDVPTEIEIWQAQMSLWIQQDVVNVLTRMNEERAAQLEKEGKKDHQWVAYMPVKHLIGLRIDAKLGKGGGSGGAKTWAASFTGVNNDDKMFKVPLQLELVVEESALMDLIDRICRTGFYTPISITYDAIKPNPLFEDYVYGEQPAVKVVIDLEAYYFRSVFEEWIPQVLKKILKTPNAADEGKP
jgi:hypothetical protein